MCGGLRWLLLQSLVARCSAGCSGNNCWPNGISGFDCDSDNDCTRHSEMNNVGAVKCGNANCAWSSWGSKDDCCVKQALWTSGNKIALYKDWDCDSDNDCNSQRFKDAMGTSRLYCGNANAPWSSLLTKDDVCVAAIGDGEPALTAAEKGEPCLGTFPWCYTACASNAGICGTCGVKIRSGGSCDHNHECESGGCAMTCIGYVATTVACKGTCQDRVPDGENVPLIGCLDFSDIGKNGLAAADYDICLSGVGFCGLCGRTVPIESRCTKHTDCAGYSTDGRPDVCCGHYDGAVDTANCGGKCMKATPKACRSAFAVMSDVVEGLVKNGVEAMSSFAQCMGTEIQEAGGMLPLVGSEGGRRLIGDDEGDGGGENGKCKGGMSPSKLTVDCERSGLKMSWSTEDNAAKYKKCFDTKSKNSDGKPTCTGGYVLSAFAETTLDTLKVKAEVDLVDKQRAKFDVDVVWKAKVGVGASMSASCSQSFEEVFPTVPYNTPPVCAMFFCFVVTLQAKVTVKLDGSVDVGATAEFGIEYTIKGPLSISLDPSKVGQSASGIQNELKKAWHIQATSGNLNGAVSVEAGPVVTIMILPGILVSFWPYATAEASVCGAGIGFDEQGGDQALLKGIAAPETCVGDTVKFHNLDKPCLSMNVKVKGNLNVNLGVVFGENYENVKRLLTEACTKMKDGNVGTKLLVGAADCISKTLAGLSISGEVCGLLLEVLNAPEALEDWALVDEKLFCTDVWELSGDAVCSHDVCAPMGCNKDGGGEDISTAYHPCGISIVISAVASVAFSVGHLSATFHD